MAAPPSLNLPVKDQSPLPVGSSDPKDIWEALAQMRSDLMTLLYQAQSQASLKIHLSAAISLAVPVAGKANCWVSSKVALPADFANFWWIWVLRQGQQEASNFKNSQNDPILAYREYFMGTFNVGMGDVLSVRLLSNGLPLALTVQDITIRCELTPRDDSNA